MDPLTLTVSITAIAGTVLQIQQYAQGVKGAKADVNRLCAELLALKGVLEHVQLLVQPSKDTTDTLQSGFKSSEDVSSIFRSSQFKDIIQDTKAFLIHLQERLGKPKGHLRTAWDRFVWPSSKTEVAEHIARIERAKTYIVMVMLGDNIESSRSIHQEIKDLIARLDEEKIADSKNALVSRLAPVDPTRAHHEACNACLAGTGLWLLRGQRFRTWHDGPKGSAIWLCGKSGAGKTTLLSSAIQHTASLARSKNDFGLAYFYCTFNDAASQEPLNILGSIIAQLARKQPSVLRDPESFFRQNEARFANLTLSSLEEILHRCLGSFERVYIFIDAVNESSSSKDIIGFISRIAKSWKQVMRSDEISSDVEKVVESSLQHRFDHLRLSNALKNKIRNTLVDQAHGMFRWVQCQLDLLSTCRTPAKVEIALKQRPITIEGTYSAMLNQINVNDRGFARNALLWLGYARRPLTLSELCEAIVFDDDCEELDDDHRLVPKPEVIHEICPGLISINSNTQEVALAHFSVRTYLASLDGGEFFHIYKHEAREFIARQCLRYISFPAFSGGFCSRAVLDEKRKSWPLLNYAALYWAPHVESLAHQISRSVEQLMHNFFESSRRAQGGGAYGFWLRALNPNGKWHVQHTKPLYYAASFGLIHVVRNILKSTQKAELDAHGGRYGLTALQSAVFRDNREVVKVLLQHGANPNARSFHDSTALESARDNHDE